MQVPGPGSTCARCHSGRVQRARAARIAGAPTRGERVRRSRREVSSLVGGQRKVAQRKVAIASVGILRGHGFEELAFAPGFSFAHRALRARIRALGRRLLGRLDGGPRRRRLCRSQERASAGSGALVSRELRDQHGALVVAHDAVDQGGAVASARRSSPQGRARAPAAYASCAGDRPARGVVHDRAIVRAARTLPPGGVRVGAQRLRLRAHHAGPSGASRS